ALVQNRVDTPSELWNAGYLEILILEKQRPVCAVNLLRGKVILHVIRVNDGILLSEEARIHIICPWICRQRNGSFPNANFSLNRQDGQKREYANSEQTGAIIHERSSVRVQPDSEQQTLFFQQQAILRPEVISWNNPNATGVLSAQPGVLKYRYLLRFRAGPCYARDRKSVV